MTLEELIDHANRKLDALGLRHLADGRIKPDFNERRARFFRLARVLAPPQGSGPGARWSDLHVQQLVTARALQAVGMSVAEAAQRMNGIDQAGLERMATEALAQRKDTSEPGAQPPVSPCPAWQLTKDFTLVAHGRVGVSPEQLARIRTILST